jgi:hypothetical protein
MSVTFEFENVFRAPSVAAMIGAYFDEDHLVTQDALAELCDRVVTANAEDDTRLHREWRVSAVKPLPLFVRPFVKGGRLAFLEAYTWRKTDNEIDVAITPDILGGRVQIAAKYQLRDLGDGKVHRRYTGTITVNVRLVSGKVERAILAEFEKSMPMMTKCTQDWLDQAHAAKDGAGSGRQQLA